MLLDDLAAYLTAQGQASVTWPLYLGYLPDDQDQVIGLFETGGMPPMTLGREFETVTFQMRVRGSKLDYVTVRTKWQALFDTLQDSLPNSDYALVQAMHYGPLMFNDEKGRTNMTANFRAIKKASSYPLTAFAVGFQEGAFQ